MLLLADLLLLLWRLQGALARADILQTLALPIGQQRLHLTMQTLQAH